MEEKKVYLSNGDLLVRTEEGEYFVTYNEKGAPLMIDREEGERLLFETVGQLKMSMEALVEKTRELQGYAEKYAIALETIANFDHGDLEQTEIALKALEEEDEE